MAQNKQNNILIFGGSSGVGLGVAKLVLKHLPDPRVIISSSNEEKVRKAVAEINETNDKKAFVDSIVADMGNIDTQYDTVEKVLKTATEKFRGQIDHIVWTAGDAFPTSSDHSGMTKMATVRLYGPMAVGKLAKNYVNDTRHSSFTISSGVRINKPIPGMAGFAGAAGLEFGARALAMDLAPIRVNYIVLGAVKTPLLESMTGGAEAAMQMFADMSLTKTVGTTEEAAEAYLYCMRCAFVTGSPVYVDGGFLLK